MKFTRNGMRTLVLSRMKSVVPLGKHFKPDPKIVKTANEEGIFDPETVKNRKRQCNRREWLPGGSVVRICLPAGDVGLIPGSGRSPREGNGNPRQDSCLENPMDGGAWWATIHGIAKESDMT